MCVCVCVCVCVYVCVSMLPAGEQSSALQLGKVTMDRGVECGREGMCRVVPLVR